MYKITVLHTSGNRVFNVQEDAPDYKRLKDAVGGLIETVPYFETFEGEPCVAFCNEEGKLHQLPFNEQAQRLWEEQAPGLDDILVGDVIVICASPQELAEL